MRRLPTAPLPTDKWPTAAPSDVGIDPARLDALVAFALEHRSDPRRGEDKAQKKADVLRKALGPGADTTCDGPFVEPGDTCGLVIRSGYVVREFGATGHVDEIASATKSFLSLLAGVAVDQGLIPDVRRSVHADTNLELLSSTHNRNITWHHLLQQTSEWDGELFDKQPTDHRGERVGEPLRAPGTFWEYNDIRVNLLARCLLEVFRKPLPDVLREQVMDPIGASSAWSWHGYSNSWTDVAGSRVQSVSGGSHWGGGIWMSARDLSRVALLYLRGGRWGTRNVVSREWIRRTRDPCRLNSMYGYLWWLQSDGEGHQVSFAASGGGSHQAFVVPDRDLVVVVKWIRDDAWPEFLDRALGLAADGDPLGPVVYAFDRINVTPPTHAHRSESQ